MQKNVLFYGIPHFYLLGKNILQAKNKNFKLKNGVKKSMYYKI